jgi:transposase
MSKKRKYRRYSEEFKEEAVKLSFSSDKTLQQIASELGVDCKNLSNWRRAYKSKQSGGAISIEDRNRIKAMEKEIKELRLERDILKKAAAIFSQDRK